MRPERPVPLDRLERDHMHPLASSATENKKAGRRTLAEAAAFRQVAHMGLDAGLSLPAVSNLHEAARLAITATATANGRRFSSAAGSHEAVVDYALAVGLVDAADHARLDARPSPPRRQLPSRPDRTVPSRDRDHRGTRRPSHGRRNKASTATAHPSPAEPLTTGPQRRSACGSPGCGMAWR